jgi:tRNA threonylcarbamoyladenosine biosynthesis protein TsaB
MNILFIDTSNNKLVRVSLEKNGEKETLTKEVGRERTQVVLPLIKELLANNKLTLADLEKIHVETGPGSFTGVRVGVAIANTLGLTLQIPINDNSIGKLVEPVYS